jgi:hypothetical protein
MKSSGKQLNQVSKNKSVPNLTWIHRKFSTQDISKYDISVTYFDKCFRDELRSWRGFGRALRE